MLEAPSSYLSAKHSGSFNFGSIHAQTAFWLETRTTISRLENPTLRHHSVVTLQDFLTRRKPSAFAQTEIIG